LVTEAHKCEQLAQGCYAAFGPSRMGTHDLLIQVQRFTHCVTTQTSITVTETTERTTKVTVTTSMTVLVILRWKCSALGEPG